MRSICWSHVLLSFFSIGCLNIFQCLFLFLFVCKTHEITTFSGVSYWFTFIIFLFKWFSIITESLGWRFFNILALRNFLDILSVYVEFLSLNYSPIFLFLVKFILLLDLLCLAMVTYFSHRYWKSLSRLITRSSFLIIFISIFLRIFQFNTNLAAFKDVTTSKLANLIGIVLNLLR